MRRRTIEDRYMIYSFDKRIDTGLNKFHYEMSDRNTIFATVSRDWDGDVFLYTCKDFKNEFSIALRRKYHDTKQKDISALICADCQIGNINIPVLHCIKKGKNIFNNEYYWEITYENQTYKCYEIGRGKEGTFYCIHRNEVTVAMLAKDPISLHGENHYDCYAYDDIPIEVLTAFNIYFDVHKYSYGGRYENKTLHTWQKWAKSKFDPDFIETIRTNKII